MHGRVAIVTGAGRGIGRAAALALARRGDRVVGVARTEAELESLAREAPGVEYVVASLDTEDGCRHAIEEARRRLGPVAVLVNNAGVGTSDERPIWEQDPAAWRRSLAVNLDAAFHLTRLAAADMVAAGFGRIVMVSSTSGLHGSAEASAYTAAKHGVIGLARAVAHDVAPHGVTANAVLPGWVRTAMSERSAEADAEARGIDLAAVWEERRLSYPTGRIPTAEEVAAVIAFLASAEAAGVNGQAIAVTHGAVW